MSEGVSSIGSCMGFSAALPATLNETGFAALTFTPSAEVTNIGDIGPENQVNTYDTVCDGKVNKRMGATNFGQQELELAFDIDNAAQIILKSAVNSKVAIAVEENLSSGDTMYYVAYVASFKTKVGGSSDYLRAGVSLEVDSAITEVAA